MEFFTARKIMVWLRVVLPVVLGAIGGYAYYYFIGCVSGSCPITSNPWSSTAYGTLLGALFVRRPVRQQNDLTQSKEQT